MREIYIGIDLAWGNKNPSGFSVLTPSSQKLQILETKLLYSIDEIVQNILEYQDEIVYIGVDAPLVIPNEVGNREIEKEFNKDFAKYKISMLPVNKKLMRKYSKNIRSEQLFHALKRKGFLQDLLAEKTLFEVYPHSTIALCFNNYKILPYKRKKGRDTPFIREQLCIYQNYLSSVFQDAKILQVDLNLLKGKSLKEYEDILDAITSAYTLYHCKENAHKIYNLENEPLFITPV